MVGDRVQYAELLNLPSAWLLNNF